MIGMTKMDFKERVPFGRTGLMVSRIGLASGYGPNVLNFSLFMILKYHVTTYA